MPWSCCRALSQPSCRSCSWARYKPLAMSNQLTSRLAMARELLAARRGTPRYGQAWCCLVCGLACVHVMLCRVSLGCACSTLQDIHNRTHKKPLSLSAQFRNSLLLLSDHLESSQPHFMRCIKPNANSVYSSFDPIFVKPQLRYAGVLETIRIRREGYSYRPDFDAFLKQYGILAFSPKAVHSAPLQAVATVLKAAGITDAKLG